MSKRQTRLLLRKQEVWVSVIGVLFLADFVFYGYMPSHRRVQALARARAQQGHVIDTAAAQAEALPALEKRHQDTARMVRRYADSVPTESDLGMFLSQIATIMKKNQLTDEVVVPGKELKADELNCIPVHMNCTGTLSGVFGFFIDLQSLHRLVRIEKITLRNDDGFTGTVAMQTEAMIFYRPEKPPQISSRTSDRLWDVPRDDA